MSKRILIVEDDDDLAQSLAEVLAQEGYETTQASNGRDALAQLSSGERPDLILLDMMMPVMNGWEFRQEQRKMQDRSTIPIITITADGDARGKAASIQAAGHLAKPVTIDRLLDEVERVCAR
jgi:CheY-like chemotaxis protein